MRCGDIKEKSSLDRGNSQGKCPGVVPGLV